MLHTIEVVCIWLFTSVHYTATSAIWGYEVTGLRPAFWHLVYPSCAGNQQSPIDIYPHLAVYDRALTPFQFYGLQDLTNVQMTLANKGYTVEVEVSGKNLTVTGGNLPGTYIIEHFHFHWGGQQNEGSEHDFNGGHFPMELHVVLHSNKFANQEQAMNVTNGLAVLGFFVQTGPHNSAFDPIINSLNKIQQEGVTVSIPAFDFSTLFPSTRYYYRYYGSLTTPPCYESVIWTIFHNVIYISDAQLRRFRAFVHAPWNSANLMDNFRDPQPLNHRIVRKNYHFHHHRLNPQYTGVL